MLKKSSDIGSKKSLTPNSELPRINYTIANRRLYNGDFRELGVVDIAQGIPGIAVNWFRRVSTFYPEFMFAQNIEVEIEGNERATEAISHDLHLWNDVLQDANRDMLRYGVGVISTHPEDPTSFTSWERDAHYEVQLQNGVINEDIFVDVMGEVTDNERLANVYRMRDDGDSKWEQYRWEGGNLGNLVNTYPIPGRSPLRQAILLEHTYDRRSIFDDIKHPIGQMSRSATALGKMIHRNSNPHLFGPDTMLARDGTGKVAIDREGMFLPMQQGDPTPGYLQWDSNITAMQWGYSQNELLIYAFTGLSNLLFNSNVQTGALSGISLRRTLIPFISKLDHYGRKNLEAIRDMVMLFNANRAYVGQEVFAFEPDDINITLFYDRVFRDAEDSKPGPEEVNPITGTGDIST